MPVQIQLVFRECVNQRTPNVKAQIYAVVVYKITMMT